MFLFGRMTRETVDAGMAGDVTSPAGSEATAAGGETAAAEPQAAGASEQPLRELSFVKLPIWQEVLGRGLLLYVAGFVLTVVVSAQAEQHWVEHALFGAILGFILLFVTIGFRWVRARHAPPQLCVQIFRDYLLAPVHAGSDNIHRLEYADLVSAAVASHGPRARLWLGTTERFVSYRAKDWHAPASHQALVAEVRAGIAALPRGPELLAGFDERSLLASVAMKRKPVVTLVLLASLVAIYVGLKLGGGYEGFGLVRFGATVRELVRQGQAFRLVSANFLHGNFVHLAVNCISLWLFGVRLERLVGHAPFLLIYLVTALTGSVTATFLGHASMTVGASTALFGVMGALLLLNVRYYRELPAGFRLSRLQWTAFLFFNVVSPLTTAGVAFLAHAGGFTGGILLAELMYRCRALPISRRAPAWVAACAAGMAVVFVAGLGRAAAHALQPWRADTIPVVRWIVDSDQPSLSADTLSAFAWYYVRESDVTSDELDVAQHAIERGLELAAKDPSLMDAMAAVHHRRGELDRAIVLERTLVEQDSSEPFHMQQLARFLAARVRGPGPLERGAGAEALTLRAHLRGVSESLSVWLDAPAYPRGAEVWLLDLASGKAHGYCWLRLAPGTPAGSLQLPVAKVSEASQAIEAASSPERELTVGLVDTESCASCLRDQPARCEAIDEELER
jgi:membrane associated rhomboid family serine protease